MWTLDLISGDLKFNQIKVGRNNQTETLVLACLISNKGALVTKESLLDVGWPGKFVAPNSLTVAIKNIRKLLSNAKSDIYIETVHRKGYILHVKKDNIVNVSTTKNDLKLDDTSYEDVSDVTIDDINKQDYGVEKRFVKEGANAIVNSEEYLFSSNNKSSKEINSKINFKIFWYLLSASYLVLVFFFAFVTTFSRYELFCYKVKRAEMCGLFDLTLQQQNELNLKLNGLTGRFVYGYDETLSEIKIYPIE